MLKKALIALVAGLTSSIANAASYPVILDVNQATLHRISLVHMSVLMSNGAATTMTFTENEILGGVFRKNIEIVSPDAIAGCRFTWAHAPRVGDIRPQGVDMMERDLPCAFDAASSSIRLAPQASFHRLTVLPTTAAFEARSADRLLYQVKPFVDAATGWEYGSVTKMIGVLAADIGIDHYVLAIAPVAYRLTARWYAGSSVSVQDPVREFEGEDLILE